MMNFQLLKPTKTLHLRSSALTDRGQMRRVNEDTVFQFSEVTQDGENIGLYIVCDGMGGQEAGEVASQLVMQTIVAALGDLLFFDEVDGTPTVRRPLTPQLLTHWFQNAILEANEKIRILLKEGTISKMGTTVNAVLIYNRQAYIANVGDSRTYLWRAGETTLITSDHTVTNEMVKARAITAEKARTHQMRNILTQSVNGKEMLESVDVFERTLQPGDRLLLCSDGLWLAYSDEAELGERIAEAIRPGDLCWQLVAEANQRDGSDNISAAAVFVG